MRAFLIVYVTLSWSASVAVIGAPMFTYHGRSFPEFLPVYSSTVRVAVVAPKSGALLDWAKTWLDQKNG